jgi:glyoxylase-like metal-dependent hydrolase (beta-lactamase superfamily II)
VRYVVVSHHHGDHLGGLRNFVAAGATVLAAPGDVAAVQALVRAPHTLAGDARSLAPPVIETIADRRVISDGTRRLEILNVGANPHTDENLLAWLPAERIAFQGDLFYYQPGAPFPPSGRGTMNRFFARWLAAHGIAPLAVYGVHNQGPAGPDALAQAGG